MGGRERQGGAALGRQPSPLPGKMQELARLAKRKEEEAQRQAKLEELKRERRVEELVRHGIAEAKDETEDWDFTSKYPVRREIEKALRAGVQADWTEEDVEDRVDEILEKWEEDQDD